jgi:beta-glucanase (GH16 family)
LQWIVLIGDENFNLSSIKSIIHNDAVQSYGVTEISGRYCFDFGKDHIFYDFSNDIINDYTPEELLKIPFKNPMFIMMVYTSEERMRKVLQQKNYLNNIYIDNDHGLIVPISEFIKHGMPVS